MDLPSKSRKGSKSALTNFKRAFCEALQPQNPDQFADDVAAAVGQHGVAQAVPAVQSAEGQTEGAVEQEAAQQQQNRQHQPSEPVRPEIIHHRDPNSSGTTGLDQCGQSG